MRAALLNNDPPQFVDLGSDFLPLMRSPRLMNGAARKGPRRTPAKPAISGTQPDVPSVIRYSTIPEARAIQDPIKKYCQVIHLRILPC